MIDWIFGHPYSVALIWEVCGLLAAGTINANARARFPSLNTYRDRRSTLVMALSLGVTGGAVVLLLSIPFTGAWQDGWSLTMKPIEQSEK